MTSANTTTQRERREAAVRKHVSAENSGDVEATIATFHSPRYNVVAMGAISEGEGPVRQLLEGLMEAFPDFHFELGRLHHADDAVIIEGVMSGTQRGDWAGIKSQGRRMQVEVACVFDFDGDRLVNESVYFDFATLQRQLAS